MNEFTEYNYLCHYGILGMKWGVRRYQNYDGTYTRQGLERYRSAETAYEASKERYKSLKKNKASKDEIREARADRKAAKKDLKDQYKRLKYDKLADEGKEYYSKGKRINENTKTRERLTLAAYAATAVAAIASHELLKGKTISTKYGDVPLDTAVPIGIAALGITTTTAVSAKHKHEDKRLRAFYGHDSYNPNKKSKVKKEKALTAKREAQLKKSAPILFEKYPQLWDDFGSPDQIDDWEMFEWFVEEYRNGD